MDMQVTGGAQLERALATLERKLGKRVIRQALRPGAKVILDHAKAICPVETGLLKRSLGIQVGRKQRKGTYSMVVTILPRFAAEIKARSGVAKETHQARTRVVKKGERYWYPTAVEFGVQGRQANAFLRPAFDTQKDAAARIVEAGVRKGIEQAAKGR